MNRTMHNGVEMVTEIVTFMNEIKKKSPRLIFKHSERMKYGYTNDGVYNYAYGGFDVFSDDDPTVKIGQIYLENTNPYNYCVMSRLISNNKYSHWSSTDHRTKKSKHMANALKIAVKTLKPVELIEVYNDQEETFKRDVHSRRNKVSSGIQTALMGVPRGSIHAELLNMIAIGYVPVDKEVKKAMDYIANTQDEIKELQAYDPDFALVRVYSDRVEYRKKDDKETHKVNEIAQLPQAIAEKMFVLNISEENKFVDGIGVKREHNTYWVVL